MAAHRVETERLILREWEDGDDESLVPVFAKPEVWHFPFRRGFEPRATRWWVQRERQRWADSGYGSFVCVHKPSVRVIGYIGAVPLTWLPDFMPAADIGWRLDPEFWGQGLATEGAMAALSYAFKALPIGDRVVAIH